MSNMIGSLRNARTGSSYLHGVALDALLSYQPNNAASRLLGHYASALRVQYSAAMLPLAFPYLTNLAYDYTAPTMSVGDDSERSATPVVLATPSAVTNPTPDVPLSSQFNSYVSPYASHVMPLASIDLPDEIPNEVSVDATRPRLREPLAAPVIDSAATHCPPRSALSLADIGRALEAHNFPQRQTLAVASTGQADSSTMSPAARAMTVPLAPIDKAILAQRAMVMQPMQVADVLIPSLQRPQPIGYGSTVSTSQSQAEGMPGTGQMTSTSASPALSPLPTVQSDAQTQTRIAAPQRVTIEATQLQDPTLSQIAARRNVAAEDKSALITANVPAAKQDTSWNAASLKRVTTREAAPAVAPTSPLSTTPRHRSERPTRHVAAPRPRTPQRTPVAFLERSQLSHMRLRLYR